MVAVAGVVLLAATVATIALLAGWIGGSSVPPVTVVSVGDSVTSAATSHYEVVGPRESEVVSVSVEPQTPNTSLKVEVTDSEGVPFDSAESVNGSVARVWMWGGGSYPVKVTADGPGTYKVDVEDVPVQPVGVDDSATGSGLSLYKVTLPEGRAASVTAVPQTPETGLELRVWNSDIDYDDTAESVDGSAARVLMSAPEGDIFKAFVTTDGPGQYDVKVEDVRVQSVDVGDSRTAAGPSIYDVEMAMGEVASVSVVPQAPETGIDVRVINSRGESIDVTQSVNGSVARVWMLGKRVYQVMVNPNPGGPGEYAVNVEAAEGTSLDLSEPVQVPGRIDEPGAGAVYEYTSSDKDPYVIRVIPDPALDAVLSVTEPNSGTLPARTTTSDGPEPGSTEEVTTDGTVGRHLIVVRGYGDSVGSFSLKVEPG